MTGFSHAGFSNVDMLDLLNMGPAVIPHGLPLDQRQHPVQTGYVDRPQHQQHYQLGNGNIQYGAHHRMINAPHQSIGTHHNQLDASNPQKQVSTRHGSGNQVGTYHESQNRGNTEGKPQNLINTGMSKQVNTHGSGNQVSTYHESQNKGNSQCEPQNLTSTESRMPNHGSRNQVGTYHESQNQGNTQSEPQNLINTGLSKQCSTQEFGNNIPTDSLSQVSESHTTLNQVSEPYTILNQVKTPLNKPEEFTGPIQTTATIIRTSSRSQSSSPIDLHASDTSSSVLPFQNPKSFQKPVPPHNQPENSPTQIKSCNPEISKTESSQDKSTETEILLHNKNVSNDGSSKKNSKIIPNGEQTSQNQYVCPSCKKSILYFNRRSLIQLLSLHQQKCPGNKEYRYMCLECHSAFKTVVQLQAHENNCSSEFLNDDGLDSKLCENSTTNSKNHVVSHGSDLHVHETVKDGVKKLLSSKQDCEKDKVDETMNYVRESWTQTMDQSDGQEVVDVLLDEISPAGRRRRSCARKMKVYNEKEMAHERENAELEKIQVMSGRKSARACKKDLKRFDKGNKLKKKLDGDVDAVPVEESKKLEKREINKVKIRKDKEPKEVELEVPLQCQLCPKVFKRYSLYTKHYQLNHERAMCQYCGMQFIRKKLKQHEKTHLKTFKCPHVGCTRVLNSKHRLKRHLRIHTGEKPYTCEICNKPFAGKENMVKHKKRVHDKERKYQCRYCGQKFADRGGLKYHENTHTKVRPTDFKCKFCGRGYKSHVGCYLHERTHTGNTYKCSFCQKEFMAKVHLRKHEYIHTGNYPFRCGNCQKGFPNNGMMKKHKCMAVL